MDENYGEYYTDVSELRSNLYSRAKSQIDKLIDASQKVATDWFGTVADVQETPEIETPEASEEQNDNGTLVTLPDGTLARLSSFTKTSNVG